MDDLTKSQRRFCMSKIRSSNTKVELNFRHYCWGKGLKGYRMKSKVVGRPDMFFPKKRIAVFIDGCFWHKCPVCYKKPKTNKKYWYVKIENNVKRDRLITSQLQMSGISVIRFWGHQIKSNIDDCFLTLKNLYEEKN